MEEIKAKAKNGMPERMPNAKHTHTHTLAKTKAKNNGFSRNRKRNGDKTEKTMKTSVSE